MPLMTIKIYMSWTKVKNFFVQSFILIIVTAIIFEIFSLFATKYDLLLFNDEPFYFTKKGIDWRSENSPWGVWHKSNSIDRHKESCFDVTYESNNVGARDNQDYNEKLAPNSIVLIGDSMAEGFGSNIEDTFAKKVQKKTNRPVLNLSAAGNFGPVQQYLIYENLGRLLPHNELVYIFIPSNDFTDNDMSYWSDQKFRYRPYFKKSGESNYEFFYPEEAIKTDNWGYWRNIDYLNKFIKQYFYSSNTLRTIRLILQSEFSERKNRNIEYKDKGYSYFFNDKDAINGSLFFIKKFMSLNDNLTSKTIIIVPRMKELVRVKNDKSYKDIFWYKSILELAKDTNSKVIDLADYIPETNIESLYLECDGHWSKKGNLWAANTYLAN